MFARVFRAFLQQEYGPFPHIEKRVQQACPNVGFTLTYSIITKHLPGCLPSPTSLAHHSQSHNRQLCQVTTSILIIIHVTTITHNLSSSHRPRQPHDLLPTSPTQSRRFAIANTTHHAHLRLRRSPRQLQRQTPTRLSLQRRRRGRGSRDDAQRRSRQRAHANTRQQRLPLDSSRGRAGLLLDQQEGFGRDGQGLGFLGS